MYMGTESEARKRFNNSRSRSQNRNLPQAGRARSQSQPRYNSNPNTRYNPNYRSRVDRFKSPGRRQESLNHDRSQTQSKNNPYPPIRCISCRCNNCYNNKKTLQEIKDLLHKKLDVKLVGQDPPCKCESVWSHSCPRGDDDQLYLLGSRQTDDNSWPWSPCKYHWSHLDETIFGRIWPRDR